MASPPPPHRSSLLPTAPLLPPVYLSLPLAFPLLLLLLLSARVTPVAASDRTLCFVMPPTDSLVFKPELTDADLAGSVFERTTPRLHALRCSRQLH